MTTRLPTLVFDAKAQLGEGALWDSRTQRLLWVDILGQRFWRHDPVTGQNESFETGQLTGTIVLRRNGGVLLALHRGIGTYDLTTRKLTMLCDPENKPEVRFNDGKCDPAGRFWAGTMPVEGTAPVGSLFCLYPDGRVERTVTGIGCSNGIVWSLDATTMYYIDTALQRVDAFDFDNATGRISNRRVAFSIPKELGYPDGSTLDAEGMLWIAHWGGACVTRWDPRTGKHLATIQLPVSQVTSVAFGGPRLDQLYITTARVGRDTEPQAGGLFCVETGIQGIPACEFNG